MARRFWCDYFLIRPSALCCSPEQRLQVVIHKRCRDISRQCVEARCALQAELPVGHFRKLTSHPEPIMRLALTRGTIQCRFLQFRVCCSTTTIRVLLCSLQVLAARLTRVQSCCTDIRCRWFCAINTLQIC